MTDYTACIRSFIELIKGKVWLGWQFRDDPDSDLADVWDYITH